jgi:excisionase family DNA binding protein
MTKLITAPQVAEVLGVSPDTVRRYLQAGRLEGQKVLFGARHQWLIDPASLENFPRGGLDPARVGWQGAVKAQRKKRPTEAQRATGFAAKSAPTPRKWDSVDEMIAAAKKGQVKPIYLDAQGNEVER